jgi:integrase
MQKAIPFATTAKALLIAHHCKDMSLHQRGQFWIDFLGEKNWHDIQPEDLEAGLAKLMNQGKKIVRKGTPELAHRPFAPATINKYLVGYASLCKLARQRYILPRTHVPASRFVEKQEVNNSRFIQITKEEILDLIKVAHLARWHKLPAIIAVAVSSGLRLGNLKALRWMDVDFDRKSITIPMTKNGSPQTSALSSLAIKELKEIQRSHHEPTDLVFGKYNFQRSFRTAVEDSGLEHKLTCFHLLRHCCASLMAQADVTQDKIMKQMGHRTPSMTSRYTHLSNQALVEAVDRTWS